MKLWSDVSPRDIKPGQSFLVLQDTMHMVIGNNWPLGVRGLYTLIKSDIEQHSWITYVHMDVMQSPYYIVLNSVFFVGLV